jgi:hypothetical protein
MAFLAPVQTTREHACIIVTYRTTSKDVPVYVVSSANNWVPEQMQIRDTASESDIEWAKLFKVPSSVGCITYKFRVGDGNEWVYDHDSPTGK